MVRCLDVFGRVVHELFCSGGFTGTPIDATLDVFGEVVDSYTMTESVKDEITVRIVYEGRAAKVVRRTSSCSIEDSQRRFTKRSHCKE